MKSFANFFTEAVETLASTEAKNRGLVGNGHGDWYDAQGNFVAKTVGGKLKYYGQGDTVSKDGIPGEEIKKKGKVQQQPEPQEEVPEENGVVVTIGRFNPPSKNHESLLKAGFREAKRRGYEYRIYPSRIQDDLSNPLSAADKVQYLQLLFPSYADYIVDNDESKTIFDILSSIYNDGYTEVVIVVGQDRLGEFQGLVHKANGESYSFNSVEVVSSGMKDPDSDVEDPGSSSLMRTSVAMNDFDKFKIGIPPGVDTGVSKQMFDTLRKNMNVSSKTEAWKIVPELDEDGLRWNYKENGLYEIGSFVENLNTGLIGEVIRRGANYLICVTEDEVMFKSWLKDVREFYEIGTTEYLNHVQKITPGERVRLFGDTVKTINKDRKKLIRKK
jgi:hypothetical protein